MAQLSSTNIYGSLAVTDTISEGGTLLSSKYAVSNHTHATSMAPNSGTSKISLAANTKYSINTGGTSYVFTTPPDTTYESKSAASGGTALSLVTTGEKYTWNNKTSNTGTVTSVTVKASSPISIDSDAAITTSGTRTISHANSGATAGSYGDSSAQTPGYGSTFKVPYVTVNATGHVTAISEHTVKIPASDNTDTKNTAGSTDTSSKIFIIGATSQAANPQTYSQDTAYVGTDGCVYSNNSKTITASEYPFSVDNSGRLCITYTT